MAEETHVLFHGKLPGKAALNRMMKELGFPIAIRPATGPLEGHSGYLPMVVRREESGVEFDVFEGRGAVEELAGAAADPRFDRSASFRWGGDENEMLAGLCAAAALARLVEGLVLDEAQNQLLTVDQAIERARETLKTVLPRQKKPRDNLPSNRPADIKRYLKPLLQERDDLVLVGRRLFIRPVRHLMRGVFFDRTSDRFRFSVLRSVNPMYRSPDSIGYGGDVGGDWRVWQPHFQPLLMTQLAQDAFAHVGQVTTFDGFAAYLSKFEHRLYTRSYQHARVTALQLAGEANRAAAYVEQLERDAEASGHRDYAISAHWKQVSDVAALCERLHAKEAETAKALKLEHIWEPSPFPVELPAAERAKVADPAFPAAPWVTVAPSPLRAPPERSGEVRFAKSVVQREGNIALVAPLTLPEAKERHREREDYILAARLPDGFLIIIERYTYWDRNEPRQHAFPTRPSASHFHIWLHGLSRIVAAHAWPHDGHPELLRLWSVSVRRLSFSSEWQAHLDFKDNETGIHDSRSEAPTWYSRFAISPTLRDAALCPMPAFGEYEELDKRVRSILQIIGYGEVT